MTFHFRHAVLALAALVAGLGALGAEPVPVRATVVPGVPGVISVAPPAENPGPRLDFTFENLPLLEVIKSVQAGFRRASTNYLNVMVPEHLVDVARTNLVTLDVKQVTVGELFNLLGMASQRTMLRVSGTGISGDGRRVPTYSAVQGGYRFVPVNSGGGNPTYLLASDLAADPPAAYFGGDLNPVNAQAEPKAVVFFQLDPYLDRYTVEDITTAVKTGWDLAGFNTRPTLKYHEETKLLVVAGARDQVGMVEQVLRALTSPTGQPTRRVNPPPQPALPGPPAKP